MGSNSICLSIPKSVEKLFHEKLLGYIEKNKPTKKQLFDNFFQYKDVLESVLKHQLNIYKSIEKYSEDGKERYRLTRRGFGMLYFSDGPVAKISN